MLKPTPKRIQGAGLYCYLLAFFPESQFLVGILMLESCAPSLCGDILSTTFLTAAVRVSDAFPIHHIGEIILMVLPNYLTNTTCVNKVVRQKQAWLVYMFSHISGLTLMYPEKRG